MTVDDQKPLKVLAIYRHYWPDTTPYAPILKLILERLASRGAEVTAYSGHPSYGRTPAQRRPSVEVLGGVQVRRLTLLREQGRPKLLRALNACYFLLRAILHAVLRRRYDIILANGHPPVAVGVTLRVIRRLTGARYILHLQDLHPEATAVLNGGKRKWSYRAALAIESESCRGAAQLITLSTDMRETLRRRGLSVERVVLANNCPLHDSQPTTEPLPLCLTDDSATRFLFAGNLGRFQNLTAIIEAASQLTDRQDWRLIFMGNGVMRASLETAAGPLLNRHVFFVDRKPISVARAAMRISDYGIVSLHPGIFRCAFPSKSLTYLAEGVPVLALVEPDSALSRMVIEHDLGYATASTSTQEIAATLRRAIEGRSAWTRDRRMAITRIADSEYGAEKMLHAWDLVMDTCAPGVLGPPPTGGELRRQDTIAA